MTDPSPGGPLTRDELGPLASYRSLTPDRPSSVRSVPKIRHLRLLGITNGLIAGGLLGLGLMLFELIVLGGFLSWFNEWVFLGTFLFGSFAVLAGIVLLTVIED